MMFSLPAKVAEQRDSSDDDDDDDNGDLSVASSSDGATVLQALLLSLRLLGGELSGDVFLLSAGCVLLLKVSTRRRSHLAVNTAVFFSRLFVVLSSGQKLSAFL